MPLPKTSLSHNPKPVGPSRGHYKFNGQPHNSTQVNIKLTPLKTLITVLVLGSPYAGLILMLYLSGLKVLAAIIIGACVSIGGLIGMLYYFNREEPVKQPADRNKRH